MSTNDPLRKLFDDINDRVPGTFIRFSVFRKMANFGMWTS